MVGLISVHLAQMHIETPLHRYRTEELFEKLHLEIAHHHVLLAGGKHHERSAAEIDGCFAKRLVHRD